MSKIVWGLNLKYNSSESKICHFHIFLPKPRLKALFLLWLVCPLKSLFSVFIFWGTYKSPLSRAELSFERSGNYSFSNSYIFAALLPKKSVSREQSPNPPWFPEVAPVVVNWPRLESTSFSYLSRLVVLKLLCSRLKPGGTGTRGSPSKLPPSLPSLKKSFCIRFGVVFKPF